MELQRALYMNIARCNMKKYPPRTGWCVRMTSMAIGINKMMLLARSSAQESYSTEPSSSSNSNLAQVKAQRSTNMKKENFTSKMYNFFAFFFPLPVFYAIFSSFIGAIYIYFENRSVTIEEKNQVPCVVNPNPKEIKQKIVPDMTGKEEVSVSVSVSDEVRMVRKQLSDGYYMRCKALILACRPQLAKQVKETSKLTIIIS